MALPLHSSNSGSGSGSLSLPRRDSSRRESISPFANRRESLSPFANRRESVSPFTSGGRRESVAPFQNALARRESTAGFGRRESTSPFPGLRRASTISHPTGSYPNIPAGVSRQFSVSSSIYSGGDVSPIEQPTNDDVEVLFHHPTRIVSFTIQEGNLKGNEVARYIQPTERTLSSGLMKIYRVKFSTAFLQGGQLLQPLLPRSACWCMDDRRGIFVLRIRKDNYYRLELQEIEHDTEKIQTLKSVLDKIIVFEKTNCPFRSEKQDVEEPAPLPVFRRSSSVASRPSRPSSAQSDYGPTDVDTSSEIVFQNPNFNAPPKIEVPPSMPVMFRKNIFEDKPMLKVPRLQVPQQHNSPSGSPRALSPLSRSPLSRNRSISPLAREVPNDMFMIPENGPALLNTDDEADSVRSVGSGPPSPRFIPRSVPVDYPSSATSSPVDPFGNPFPVIPRSVPTDFSDSAASSPIDPLSHCFPGKLESRGRSPERKSMLPSPPPTAISPPVGPINFLRPPSVVIQNADDDVEIDFLDLGIRHGPLTPLKDEFEEPEEVAQELYIPPQEEPQHEPLVEIQNEPVHEKPIELTKPIELPKPIEIPIFEPLPEPVQEPAPLQIRPRTPLPSPPATPPPPAVSRPTTPPPSTPPLSHSTSDSESDEIAEALTPESTLRRKPAVETAPVSRRASEPITDTSSHVIIQDNDPDSFSVDSFNMRLVARAQTLPVAKTRGPGDYEPLSRTGRRFIRSMDHEAARGIFGKTINLTVHKPSSFLLRFMLRVADKLMKGAKIYVYYWGDWKKGKVKGKGGKVTEETTSDVMFESPLSPEQYEKMGLLSDEDDYGVNVANSGTEERGRGRQRTPYSRNGSI